MVTIEQKLMLFENLIQHDIFEKAKLDKHKKEQYYKALMIENKEEIDRISQEMKIEEKQKLDRIYVKEEAQIKKVYENSYLKTKEDLLNKLLHKIEEKLGLFTDSDGYKKYIDVTINKVCTEIDFDKDIILCMTEKDIQTYGEYILNQVRYKNNQNIQKQEVSESSIINELVEDIGKDNNVNREIDIKLDKERDSIIGGFIVKTVDGSMRYDFSLKRNMEDSMPIILKNLNAIIEEGDTV